MSAIRSAAALVALLAGAVPGGTALAQSRVGEVTFVQGLVSAQRPGAAPRLLDRGEPLFEGEVVTTGARAYAQLQLADGTRMTLRPDTGFAVSQLSQQSGQESLTMQLLRGGLRAITGLISRSGPDRMRIQTTTATIGVRGTEFDARLCTTDCAQEQRSARPAPAAQPQADVVGRVATLDGSVTATTATGATRMLAPGAALFGGDTVRTAAGAVAVIAFRDRSVVTLTGGSEFRLQEVRFRPAAPGEDSLVLRLVTGGLRVLSGALATRRPAAVRVETTTATIGVRGTGLDVRLGEDCVGAVCKADSTFVYVWARLAFIAADGREVDVPADRAAVFGGARAAPVVLEAVPAFFLKETAPRPDTVEIDFDRLFAVRRLEDVPPGLYVGVRVGNVTLGAVGGESIDLGPFEAGLLREGSQQPERIEPLPAFLFSDPFPIPDGRNPNVRLIELLGLGGQGSLECEVR